MLQSRRRCSLYQVSQLQVAAAADLPTRVLIQNDGKHTRQSAEVVRYQLGRTELHTYFLADRSNAAIDLINTVSKSASQLAPARSPALSTVPITSMDPMG